ncbi:hypothetical protein [Nocardia sp. CC227C]|nr:hypothetical protein [Nocardia sp. CC227C]
MPTIPPPSFRAPRRPADGERPRNPVPTARDVVDCGVLVVLFRRNKWL